MKPIHLTLAVAVWCIAASLLPAFAETQSSDDTTQAALGKPEFQPGTPMLDRRWPADPDKFHFAILGDRTHGTSTQWPVFDRAVDEINLLQPDFVVMVGDMIEGNTDDLSEVAAQWAEFMAHAEHIAAPLLLIPGNHDISNPDMRRWWRENIGCTHYSFSYKGCHFLMLSPYDYWAEGGSFIGDDQLQFALDALERNEGARHTFVFIHPPVWQDNDRYWARMEAALAGRPYTVFCGHVHRLSYEQRRDARYFVLSSTLGEEVRSPNPAPEFGWFPHFTQVTVEGEAAHVAIVEPGGIWPEDVARRSVQESVADFFKEETYMPEGLEGATAATGFTLTMNNALPAKTDVHVEIVGPGAEVWQPVNDRVSYALVVPPGETATIEARFTAPTGRVLPVPRLRCRVTYKGIELLEFERNINLFPDSALRWAPDWMVVGPYDAGPLPSKMPDDPRAVMPALFVPHGPENGYVPGAAFTEDDRTISWQPLSAQPQYGLGFINVGKLYGVPSEDFAYALSAVHSPTARTVYARFRVDDYGQIFVNGEPLDNARLFRTRRDPEWVAAPLQAGWNTVVVKSIAISGGWSFRLLFADPEGTLEFAPYPPQQVAEPRDAL